MAEVVADTSMVVDDAVETTQKETTVKLQITGTNVHINAFWII